MLIHKYGILRHKMKESSPVGYIDTPDPQSTIPESSDEILEEVSDEKSVQFLDKEFIYDESDQEFEEYSNLEYEEILDQESETFSDQEFVYRDSEQFSDDESDIGPTYLEYDNTDSSQDCDNDALGNTNESDKNEDPKDMYTVVESDYSKSRNDTRFHCEVCNTTFNNKMDISEHLLLNNSCRECEICHNVMNKNAYNSHIKLHEEYYKQRIAENKVQCNRCGKTVGKSYLKFHMLLHGSQKDKLGRKRQCPICDKSVNYHYISEHMKRVHLNPQETSTEESVETCPIRDKAVKETETNEHIASQTQSKNKQYVCDQCGKILKYPSAFKTHLLTHTGNLTYKCEYCPYRGLHLGLLKVHVRTHTKDYAYICVVCKKKFITKSNLSRHERSKHKPPQFSCSKCGRKFTQKRRLEEHVNVIHLNIRNEKCDVCDKAFGTKNALKSHLKKVHKIRSSPSSFHGRIANYLKAELVQNS